MAYDSAYPEATAEAQLFINVTRNVNGPRFQPSATYEKVIVDSYGVGEEILSVRATDGDSTVGVQCLLSVVPNSKRPVCVHARTVDNE